MSAVIAVGTPNVLVVAGDTRLTLRKNGKLDGTHGEARKLFDAGDGVALFAFTKSMRVRGREGVPVNLNDLFGQPVDGTSVAEKAANLDADLDRRGVTGVSALLFGHEEQLTVGAAGKLREQYPEPVKMDHGRPAHRGLKQFIPRLEDVVLDGYSRFSLFSGDALTASQILDRCLFYIQAGGKYLELLSETGDPLWGGVGDAIDVMIKPANGPASWFRIGAGYGLDRGYLQLAEYLREMDGVPA